MYKCLSVLFIYIYLCHDLCLITDVRVQKVKKREFEHIVYPKTQKKKKRGGGDGINLIM